MRKMAFVLMLIAIVNPNALGLGQGAGGTISGRVEDQSGAVLPGASVMVKNVDTGIGRTLVTDEAGRYYAPNLSLGQYEVRAELPGFSTGVRSGIQLTVGREAVVDLQLKVGQFSENVTVTGEAPMIQLTNASTAGLIDQLQMQTMPLNGRSFIELAAMVPGVQIAQVGQRGASFGFGTKLSVNGARYTANLFTIDGTQINDEYNQAGSASGNMLGVEAVREFQVLTNSFSAEYGRHTGAVINAATKAGTNELHGSVFEFLRNDNLDARNFFDGDQPPELEGIQYSPDQPYMMKWNLNIQREIAKDTTVEVGYTGTRGVHLLRVIHTNGREVFTNSDGRLQVLPTTPLRQPNFGRMRLRLTDSTSDYHGLTTSFNRRLNSGLQFQVSYTFSKALDDGASVLGNDFDTDAGGSRYLFSKDRGRAVTDVRHYFGANFNYRLPFGETAQGWARLIQGWNLGSLMRLNSGPPFSVTAGYDASLQVYATSYPDLKPGSGKNPILGGPDRYYDPNAFVLPPNGVLGNLGRNTLEGPGTATVDMVLAKDSRIKGERATLQFRAEVFNMFNHPNFGIPVQTVFTSSRQVRADAGRITRTTTSARQIQFGLKLLW